MKDGFIKIGACTAEVKVANTKYNVDKVKEEIKTLYEKGVKVMVFPELCLTAYTCGDLFYDETLLDSAKDAIKEIKEFSKGIKAFIAVGAPIRLGSLIYNVAVAVCNGEILGFVPKTYLPNYSEFYEKRVFAPAPKEYKEIIFDGKAYPFSNALLFSAKDMLSLKIGIEICEDLWTPVPPSVNLAVNGATVILNLSASNELVGKAEYRKELVSSQSAKLICVYAYANSGTGESTTDVIYSGHTLIGENGRIVGEGKPFAFETATAVVDLNKLVFERNKHFNYDMPTFPVKEIFFDIGVTDTLLEGEICKTPFVPSSEKDVTERAELILTMQANALKKRLVHTNAKSAVIGLSGGLDSTLAVIVTAKAFDLCGKDRKEIIAVTMPCFGTTDRTFCNSVSLAKSLRVTLKKVDIKKAVLRHFKDIGQDEKVKDVTYENCQARERTQVLMDIANKTGGFVVGTGDLSESALGWCTYSGDHISMYNVNATVPKTLVKYLVKYVADNSRAKLKNTLNDILLTPVSPELIPPENGKISQITEDVVGPYILHDFFLYYYARCGFTPKKIFRIAVYAFKGDFTKEEIFKWLNNFYGRFFSQQFKRSCMPDGVKIGSVALSPRGDLRMPSDADKYVWKRELDKIKEEYGL